MNVVPIFNDFNRIHEKSRGIPTDYLIKNTIQKSDILKKKASLKKHIV